MKKYQEQKEKLFQYWAKSENLSETIISKLKENN